MQRQMMKQMKKRLEKQMAQMQEDLNESVAEGIAGSGMVKVQINGQMELLSVKIDPSVVDPEEVDMLEDLIVVAFQEAMGQVQAKQAEMMQKMAGGLPIPPGLI